MYKIILLSIVIISSAFEVNSQANFQWAKSMGGSGNDEAYSIIVDASGNVYTTGAFAGTVDFDPGISIYTLTSTSQEGIFISKLDATGNFIWAKQIGGTSSLGDIATAIAVDATGNIYTTGYYYGTEDFDPGLGVYTLTAPSSTANAFVSKLDALGNFVWVKDFGPSDVAGFGLTVDAGGFIYTTGSFYGTVDFDPGGGVYTLTASGFYGNVFISKLDASGTFVWAKQIGVASGTVASGAEASAIAVDVSGNVYTTGFFNGTVNFDPGAGSYTLTSLGLRDVFINKLDASGNFSWTKQIGSTGSDNGYSVAVDVTGNVYTTGTFTGTVDFDPGATIYNLTTTGGFNVFISKLTSSGTFLWAKNFVGSSSDIAVDSNNNVYTTGAFGNTTDFDPDAGVYNLTSAGQSDIFISKLDASGVFIWAKQMGGTLADFANSIVVDAAANVYTTGRFNGIADFDPGTSIYNLTSSGQNDIFVLKLDNAVGIKEFNYGNHNVNIYPNPTTGNVTIVSKDISEGELQISIKDVSAKIIYESILTVANGKCSFNIEAACGVYFLEIIDTKTKTRTFNKIIIVK